MKCFQLKLINDIKNPKCFQEFEQYLSSLSTSDFSNKMVQNGRNDLLNPYKCTVLEIFGYIQSIS